MTTMAKVLLIFAVLALIFHAEARYHGYDAEDIDEAASAPSLPVRAVDDGDLDQIDEEMEMRRQLRPYFKDTVGGLRYTWNNGRTSLDAGTRLSFPYTPNVQANFNHQFRNGVRLGVGGEYAGSKNWNIGATLTIPLGRRGRR